MNDNPLCYQQLRAAQERITELENKNERLKAELVRVRSELIDADHIIAELKKCTT